jgi:hypothetical protein
MFSNCVARLAARPGSDAGAHRHATAGRALAGAGLAHFQGGFQFALLVGAALYVQVMMLFWFSPVLAAWHGVAVPKALFFSFFAVLMNWRAFLAYGMVTALVTVVAPFVTALAMTAFTGGKGQLAATGLLFPLLLVIMPTLFGSFYASYRDIFAAPSDAQAP